MLWTGAGTNCVDTDTGMSANVATGGFLGLGSSAVGGNQYLLKPNGKTKCANGGTTEATTVLMGQTINNDTLSCFFINGTMHVGDVDATTYTPPRLRLISDAIYNSPAVRVRAGAARAAGQRWQQQVPDHRLPGLLHHRPAWVGGQG